MLEIKPIEQKSAQADACSAAGIKYLTDTLAYGARNDGALVGVCQFAIKGDCGYIYDLVKVGETEDLEALIIMCRVTLNFIDLCGANRAEFIVGSTPERLIHSIGIKSNDAGKYLLDLKGFFEHHCK